ncbi:erythromycin esterase family protein [Bacillus manliponensis]|uniref:erythromycin esterase family protein n=1 Tax=Bacillus manliponensis TaxID=574376 RepID=UPI003514B155
MLHLINKIRSHWKKQIASSAHEINVENEITFSCIDPYIKGKRIILLGESSHGVGDYQTVKTQLIRYLHEKHGFNVVVLENGFMETTLGKEMLCEYSKEMQIQTACLDIYHTEEMLDLFHDEWAQTLHLTGMDIQSTYPNVSNKILLWLQQHTNSSISTNYERLDKRYFQLEEEIRIKLKKSKRPEVEEVINEYKQLLIDFDKLIQENKTEKLPTITAIRRGILNRIQWLQVCMKGYWSSGALRSDFMFQNIEWLLNDYYRGEKIIIWAHNYHIKKAPSMFESIINMKPVGEALSNKYNNDVYSIGFYAGSGEMATFLRVDLPVVDLKKSYLESLFYKLFSGHLFIDLRSTTISTKKRFMWYNRKWGLLEGGRGPRWVNPQKVYDAIFFLNEVYSPNYLPLPDRNLKNVENNK